MTQKKHKQKANNAALRHQKHFWGSLLLSLLLWLLAAALPFKYENLIFLASTGGIFCGFYAFMVIATYDSAGRLRPRPSQIRQRIEEEAVARLSLVDEPEDIQITEESEQHLTHSMDKLSI